MIEKHFIQKWVEKLDAGKLKTFPSEFLFEADTKTAKMPGKILVLGPELFGSFELLDSEGNTQYQAPDLINAKFILYSNRAKPTEVLIPVDEIKIDEAIKSYEKYLDDLVKEIVLDFKTTFPKSSNQHEVTNQIFNALKLQRY